MWDDRYSEPGFAYGVEANDFLCQMRPRIPPGRVLCLGEGEGRNAVHLAQHGYEVTAVDASSVGLGKARDLARERGVSIHTEHCDLADFEIEPNAWSGIVSIWCHVPQSLRQRLHRQVVAGLAPGGVLILEAYTPAQLNWRTGGPPTTDLMMQLDELREELAGLTFEHACELERDVHEGRYHNGHSAVVQVLALKPR
ncbi:MAG: SAM-dependent methyltransferase [Gammaproteobacteria bacterium SG8_47]|nr:MAG: SAM-dependent methyltransferase [Gammaproteobacteria bacterium SG8_47]